METKVMSADTVRRNWREVMDGVTAGKVVLVERHKKPVVAVISYEDFMAISEQLEELHDLRLAKQALEEYRRDPSRARRVQELIDELEKEVTSQSSE